MAHVYIISMFSRRDLLSSNHTLRFVVKRINLGFIDVAGVQTISELPGRNVFSLVVVDAVPGHYNL